MTLIKYSTKENVLAFSYIAIASLFGFISNGLSLRIIRTNMHFRNAYGILCSAVVLCNLQTLSVIFIWGTYILLIDSRPLLSIAPSVTLIPGCLANVSFYASIVLNVLIALNRYYALAHPLKYHHYWSIKKARKASVIIYFLGFIPCLPSIFESCTLIFNAEQDFRWSYNDTPCGYINGMFDTSFSTSSLITTTTINFLTVLKIRTRRNLEKASQGITRLNNREILFFKQSCISGFVTFAAAIFFNFGQYFLVNKWALFAATTLSWLISLALDGFILLIYIWRYMKSSQVIAESNLRRQAW